MHARHGGRTSSRVQPLGSVERTARLIAPSLVALGLGLVLLPWTGSGLGLVLATGAVAAAAGILLPVMAFWISLAAGTMQGRELGWQTSVASLGQAIAAALAGVLASTSGPLNGGILLTGLALMLAGLSALRNLPRLFNQSAIRREI